MTMITTTTTNNKTLRAIWSAIDATIEIQASELFAPDRYREILKKLRTDESTLADKYWD